ncbi:endonuclease/exonuclease/phosphatase family protein [Bacteroides sp. UBA939]|uniref:endonuclease/exonuclease/phosphatase family protein n=1 Tax=Bacteroides sp. UBA939 TaxID=1946092 RepID=UPI0025BCF9AA|nr:endonuclease/exonuclease/phosphatase family protein [Bacteroides sp. UBA939]
MGKSEVKTLFRSIPVILTLFLGIVTIAAAFSKYYNPADSVYMPILGLVLPILLICNFLVAICWAFARRRRAFVPLAALIFNWSYILAIFQFSLTKEIPEGHYSSNYADGYLKVATYNVGNFGDEITGYSCKEIARFMKQQEVDVLCFQEFNDNQYFPMDSIRKVFSHWRYASMPTEDTTQGVLPIAIFSRYPLINAQFISYPQSVNCSMQCDIVLGHDTVRLLNNHLQTTSVNQNRHKWERDLANTSDTRREAEVVQGAITSLHDNFMKRAGQTDSICQLILASPYPVVACGDFNSLPSSYTYRKLSGILKDGFRTCGRGYMYTYRYFKRLLRIDYIFHSPGIRGYRYYSPDLDLCSDHNPVLMEMKIK